MAQEIEHMTEREMRRFEWTTRAGALLLVAATIVGVVWLLDLLFNS